MDIREALLAEHSKRQTMKIVRYINGDPARFAELMKLFLGDTYRLSQRAAWAVNYCADISCPMTARRASRAMRYRRRR